MSETQPPQDFHIAFETRAFPGANGRNMRSLKITIGHDITDKDDDSRKFNVGLCAHPLYAELERYVKANPSTPQPKQKGDKSKFKVHENEQADR
jgi:hypothetical protein